MKILIFNKNEDGSYGEKLYTYEADSIDSTANYRPHFLAEPKASHFELPEGMDEECVVLEYGIIQEAQEIELEPAILDEENNVITPARTMMLEEIQGYRLVESAELILAKRQKIANENLNKIRALREPLLEEADHTINTIEDDALDASSWRAYRKSLRECTDDLKKVNGDAKLLVEDIVPSEFEFPNKPE